MVMSPFCLNSYFSSAFFPQLDEQWMVDVKNWDHKPLLLFFLTNHHSQIPFWNVLNVLILFMVVTFVALFLDQPSQAKYPFECP
jgi:hypothetical protein